ncbi:MAG: hypothetical protein JWM59_2447 [Verrucomicrobiales bacterium]|nr:hypothetical protein [Verrucomicrobiales bacterium]
MTLAGIIIAGLLWIAGILWLAGQIRTAPYDNNEGGDQS